MIKAVIFDFDGVLVESASIKTEAFRDIFSKWPDKVEKIVDYHKKNMGISRYVKFEHCYKYILNKPYSKEKERSLGRQFSNLVLEKIKKCPFVEGAKDFLSIYCGKYLLFIASGTPQEEIDEIVSFRKIDEYFTGVFGTPSVKKDIIRNILKKYSLDKDEVVFVGDAGSDLDAATVTGVHFILRINSENHDLIDSNISTINNIKQLIPRITEMNK